MPLCFAFVVGILLPSFTRPWIPFLLAASCVVAALACMARSRLRISSAWIVAAFLALGSAADTVWGRFSEGASLRRTFEDLGSRAFVSPRRVEGRLRREAQRLPHRTVLIVDAERLEIGDDTFRVRGGMRVSVGGERQRELHGLTTGDRVGFWGRLSRPSYFRNRGGFDGEAHDVRRRIDVFASVKSALLVSSSRATASATSPVSSSRLRVLERLEEALPDESFGVALALVTGERSALSPELERLYRRAGIFHVMAISGAHVAVLLLSLHFLLRASGIEERAALVLLLLLLPVYAAFCGSRAPILRSVAMATIVIGARLLSVRSPTTNGLALAALSFLVWRPRGIEEPGFQLTFAAMAGIGVFSEDLSRALSRLGVLSKPLAIALAAQMGVLPLAGWHFHRMSPLAPVASLAAMPVAASICVLGIFLVLVSGVPLLGSLTAFSTHHAVRLLTAIADLTAAVPGASVLVGTPSFAWLTLYAVALLCIAARWRRVGILLLSGLLLSIVFPRARGPRDVLEITAIDVGHGDSVLLSLPSGGNILIDGGGLPRASLDIGEAVVLPYLLERGVRSLDAVVLSHADFDHIGGLGTVIDELSVGEIWEGEPEWERSAYRELRARAAMRKIPFRTLRAGETIRSGGVLFHVLSAGETARAKSNDRSLVLRVSYAGRSLLLTGDAEAALEEELLRSGLDVRADVLKLGHHGSRSSTTTPFLDAVGPDIAIVSGRRNGARRIPSPRVLHRLRERAIEYARTDEQGTVTVTIHRGGAIEVSTYRMEKGFSKAARGWQLATGS